MSLKVVACDHSEMATQCYHHFNSISAQPNLPTRLHRIALWVIWVAVNHTLLAEPHGARTTIVDADAVLRLVWDGRAAPVGAAHVVEVRVEGRVPGDGDGELAVLPGWRWRTGWGGD